MAQEEVQFTFADILGIIKRNWFLVTLLVLLGGSLGFTASLYVPKRFRATAELVIQSSYFHNPLVNDIVASIYDPTELNAQKATLFRLALNEEFLDTLGEKYDLYTFPAESDGRVIEREELLKNIQYYSLSSTTYFLAARAADARLAYQLLRDIFEQVRQTLIIERRDTLVKTRDAIRSSVESLGLALRDVADPFAAQRKELEKLDVEIRTLTSKFSESHPQVLALRRQAKVLRQALFTEVTKPGTPESDTTSVYANSAKASTQDIHHELLKKLSYLNIVLEMEQDDSSVSYLGVAKEPAIPVKPFFPVKRIFAAVGLAAGFLLAIIWVVFRELHRGTFLSPAHASDALGVDFLGVLPQLVEGRKEHIRLLDSPQRLLPYTAVVGDEG